MSLHQSRPVHTPDIWRQSAQQLFTQRAQPVLHVIPQVPPEQVAAPLAVGAGHGVQEVVPQEATLLLEVHAPEQT
jgi:hypothetical protein